MVEIQKSEIKIWPAPWPLPERPTFDLLSAWRMWRKILRWRYGCRPIEHHTRTTTTAKSDSLNIGPGYKSSGHKFDRNAGTLAGSQTIGPSRNDTKKARKRSHCLVMVKAPLPVFCTVRVSLVVVPTATVPKALASWRDRNNGIRNAGGHLIRPDCFQSCWVGGRGLPAKSLVMPIL